MTIKHVTFILQPTATAKLLHKYDYSRKDTFFFCVCGAQIQISYMIQISLFYNRAFVS